MGSSTGEVFDCGEDAIIVYIHIFESVYYGCGMRVCVSMQVYEAVCVCLRDEVTMNGEKQQQRQNRISGKHPQNVQMNILGKHLRL